MPNKSFYIKVRTKGKNPLQWFKEVEKEINYNFANKIAILGDQTAQRMGEIIKNSAKRESTGLLGNSIKSEILSMGIGIGRISELPLYWELINDGGTYVTKETFIPPPFADGEFRTFKQGSTHTIKPVRYIDQSDAELKVHIALEINRLMKKEKQLSK